MIKGLILGFIATIISLVKGSSKKQKVEDKRTTQPYIQKFISQKKQCTDCQAIVDPSVSICPNCGGSHFILVKEDEKEIEVVNTMESPVVFDEIREKENDSITIFRNERPDNATKPEPIVRKKDHSLLIALSLSGSLLLLSVVGLFILLLILPSKNNNNNSLEDRYLRAETLIEDGDYFSASEIYLSLKDYKDSPEKYKETRYLFAKELMSEGKDTAANNIFKELGDYKDSASLIHNHSFKILSSAEATCISDGYTESQCEICGQIKEKTIEKYGHNYSAATCTEAKKCLRCGETDGLPLGHAEEAVCSRCGLVQFQSLTFSGYGPGVIKNLTLPIGTYNICGSFSGESNFIADFYRNVDSYGVLIANKIGKCETLYTIKSSKFNPVENAYIDVIHADGYWTFTIEAIK